VSAFNSVIEAASAYAELGLPIIPIRAGTKVPATPRGKDDATVDPAQISDWFERNPSNGVGILTGPKSGVMVLDKDPRNGGEESYQRFIEEHGPLSLTPVVETGGGGTHHYFSVPVGWTAGDRTNIPGYPGLDLKCGGYCVAPPSLHPSGAYYRWAEGRSPSEVPLAPLPGALRAILSKPKLPSGGTTSIAEGGIRSGSRNDTLFLRASKLHRQGYTNAEVSGAIHALNQFTCNPPLEDREVDTLVRSATGYEVTPRGDQSDLDNARRLVEARSGLIRYNTASKQWLIWAGTHWKRDDNQEMMRRAKACADRLSEEAEGLNDPAARKLQKAFALKSKSARSLKAALELAASEPGVPISANEFDRQSHLLNVANGTVDLRTGKLRAHNPDDLITKLIDVSYDPAATCETWQRFLADVTGHDCELQQYLKVAFGYASTGETSEQCIFLLYGSGANGKSTCLDAIRTVLGPYALQSSIETFLSKPTGGIPNDLARLHGARFVTASEADAGRRMV
jgi:putative DNA primase/helicase